MRIVFFIAAQTIVFKIRLFSDKIINGDSKKVEDTKEFRPASNGFLDYLPI